MTTDLQLQVPIVCIFCGSSSGNAPEHTEAARSLAQAFHVHRAQIVYGGGTTGVMGELARTYVQLAGSDAVCGIIPKAMMELERSDKPTNEQLYGRVIVVPDMHARAKLMASMVSQGGHGSGFIALSGGYGTMAEAMECVTNRQLGLHHQSVIMYNVRGYWDEIFTWIRGAVQEGFIKPIDSNLLLEAKTARRVVELLQLPPVNS